MLVPGSAARKQRVTWRVGSTWCREAGRDARWRQSQTEQEQVTKRHAEGRAKDSVATQGHTTKDVDTSVQGRL